MIIFSHKQAEYTKAHDLAEVGLRHAERLGKKEWISRASWVLAQLDYQSEEYKEAFEHQAMYMQYKDSMDVETVDLTRYERERAQLMADRAEANLELESQKRKQERAALWATGVTALLFIIVAMGVFGRYRYMRKTNKIISEERDRSEDLLLNILPKETAHELKEKGRVRAQRFDAVTVLFTDFQGFTKHAESIDPEKLVKSLDHYFGHFDTLMDKYGLEKIKTVGDAYMCASGLPFPSPDHAHRVVEAAMEMLEFVEASKTDPDEDHIRFDIRIGINSGPVVAGIVGTKKFAYDIWGDTVNIASRMESTSETGRINIAEETYQLVRDDYECEYRGEIDAKNRGKLNMYFLVGRKTRSKTA
ncbi:MAG: adenylate/guanylate cyclase domain-containing protein [Robiginitalea sp.]|nr:adenylate/guanylate cyclase domain-containing protein [Robiginitalea sp.]